MKKALLILACSAIVGCDVGYKHHPDVLAATRDPLFDQWLKRNDLELVDMYQCYECTDLRIRKVDSQAEVK